MLPSEIGSRSVCNGYYIFTIDIKMKIISAVKLRLVPWGAVYALGHERAVPTFILDTKGYSSRSHLLIQPAHPKTNTLYSSGSRIYHTEWGCQPQKANLIWTLFPEFWPRRCVGTSPEKPLLDPPPQYKIKFTSKDIFTCVTKVTIFLKVEKIPLVLFKSVKRSKVSLIKTGSL